MTSKRDIFDLLIGVLIILFAFIFFLLRSNPANASYCIEKSKAIRAIIGEASGEGYKGMLAVACAIRNRGHLRGVYGLKAKHVDKEPQWVWDLATKAWTESRAKDITNGATHWESDTFKKPYWAKSMTKTVKIGHHQFYKLLKRG